MRHFHSVRIVSWEDEVFTLRAIRTAVFIHEQRVPENLEWDEFDAISLHVLAFNPDGQPVGTARLLPDGHIGRMAVLKEWRGKGYGSAVLQRILEELRNRHSQKQCSMRKRRLLNSTRNLDFMLMEKNLWKRTFLILK